MPGFLQARDLQVPRDKQAEPVIGDQVIATAR